MLTARSHSSSILAILVLVLILLGTACTRLQPATDFQVTLFDGEDFQLSDQAGQSAVVLNFWYPSCPPCREEMPYFEAAWEQHQSNGIRFLGLFVPMGFDSEQDAKNFVDDLGLSFEFGTDQQALIALSYQVEYFPTTFFIDAKGKIFKKEIRNLDTEAIDSILADMDLG